MTGLYIRLISSHPDHKEQWGWVLFSRIYNQWDKKRDKKQWSCAHGLPEANPEVIFTCVSTHIQSAHISTARICWQPLPFPSSRTWLFKRCFTTHSPPSWLPCFGSQKSWGFSVPLPLRVAHTYYFVVPCDNKDQSSVARELPVYPMYLTLRMITAFKILGANGKSLSSVGLYRQSTKDCAVPTHSVLWLLEYDWVCQVSSSLSLQGQLVPLQGGLEETEY